MADNLSILYFVTSNNNKFHEVSELFEKEVTMYKLIQSKIEPIEIQAKSLQEVALFKLNSI
ncbi:MAG TPA: non-canonical purine NTP pyrophosphatase, partial [Candidatus Lokiarchaeia archaeon]